MLLFQLELITAQAMKAGFTGGLVVDYPNSTKAKKYFFNYFDEGFGIETYFQGVFETKKCGRAYVFYTVLN